MFTDLWSLKYNQKMFQNQYCGLWFGSRGGFGESVLVVVKEFLINPSQVIGLSEIILMKTCHILTLFLQLI